MDNDGTNNAKTNNNKITQTITQDDTHNTPEMAPKQISMPTQDTPVQNTTNEPKTKNTTQISGNTQHAEGKHTTHAKQASAQHM